MNHDAIQTSAEGDTSHTTAQDKLQQIERMVAEQDGFLDELIGKRLRRDLTSYRDDAKNEIFIKAFLNAPNLRDFETGGTKVLESWLRRIGFTVITDLIKKHKQWRKLKSGKTVQVGFSSDAGSTAEDRHPVDRTETNAMAQEIRDRAKAILSEEDYTIFIRHTLGDTLQAIAHDLGLALGTVYGRYKAALTAVRRACGR